MGGGNGTYFVSLSDCTVHFTYIVLLNLYITSIVGIIISSWFMYKLRLKACKYIAQSYL